MEDALNRLKQAYSHRTPNAESQLLLREIRQRTLDLAVFIEASLPSSRERSIAQTHLEEVRMWLCNAAVASGEIREELAIHLPASSRETTLTPPPAKPAPANVYVSEGTQRVQRNT